MKKQCNVVMLPTNESKFHLNGKTKRLVTSAIPHGEVEKWNQLPQHLYITSDEPIKEVDWTINTDTNELFRAAYDFTPSTKLYKKIVATTDPKLHKEVWNKIEDSNHAYMSGRIPKISEDFIQAYVKAYNTAKPITSILVEYDSRPEYDYVSDTEGTQLVDFTEFTKLDSTGCISISLVEEQRFTREDMKEAFNAGATYMNMVYEKGNKVPFIMWIDKHYPQINK